MRTTRPNLTADKDVKYHFSSLCDVHGVEPDPRTAVTPRMTFHLFDSVIEKKCPRPFIRARTALDMVLEGGCGMRVGEALTSGDFHGLKADHLRILRRVDSGLVTIEGFLEHSKTKFKRYVNCLGTTLGTAKLPAEAAVRSYWKQAGFKVVQWTEGGYEVTSVDYRVARVSFLGMADSDFERLMRYFTKSGVAEVRAQAATLEQRSRARKDAKHSKDKRYINVFGGPFEDSQLGLVFRELEEAGFGPYVRMALGPLLRASAGHHITHMPLDPTSTYSTLHAMLDEAYVLANPEGDPDPWLDLQGLSEPLWGHHSFRRMADTVARATMDKTGATEEDIDRIFGWNERMYSMKMQHHYSSRFNRDKRYRVTMYL